MSDRDQLVRALRETVAGRSVIDPLVVDALVGRRVRVSNSALRALTDRELAVLGQMAQGRTNAGIAEELYVPLSAVEKHINAIFLKLGLTREEEVHRRVAAVLRFLEHTP